MRPYLFVVRGDLTRIQADAVVYSISTRAGESGDLTRAMHDHVPGFEQATETLSSDPLALGEVRWLELPRELPGETDSRVRLRGVIAAATVDREVSAGSVRDVVRRSIALALERLPPDGRLLIAFPSLGTGSNGTGRHRAPELARIQVEALADVLDEPAVADRIDAVVVAYSKSAYRRFIDARRALRSRYDWLEPPIATDAAQTLVDAIQRRECVLFVGSGLSIGAGLSSWSALVERLVSDVPGLREFMIERARGELPAEARGLMPDDWTPRLTLDDFLDLAQWHYQTAHSGRSHQAYIHELFGNHGQTHPPTLAHYLLLSLPFQTIVTTNYDNLIEDTLDALRVARVRVVRDAEVPLTGDASAVSVVKLHGHAAQQGSPELDDAIVLTRDEYDQFFERHPAKARLLESLLLNHHFCFYGYSLSDPDLRQIFNRAVRMLRGTKRAAWSISPFETPPWSRDQWAAKGLTQIGFQPHHTHGNEVRQLMLWLDGLAEHAAEQDQTFLTRREDAPTALSPVRATLQAMGAAIEALHRDTGIDLDADDVEVLEPILELLEHLGWQPAYTARSDLWEQLSEAVLESGGTDAKRVRRARQLLYRALASATSQEALEHAKARLAALAERE